MVYSDITRRRIAVNYDKEKEIYLSCCGSYCHTCDWFTGCIRLTGARMRRMMKEYSNFPRLFGEEGEIIAKSVKQLSTTSICSGCQQEGGLTDRCKIRSCCHSKGLLHCSECPAFPCKLLADNPGVQKFKTLENFAEITRMGWQIWVEEQWKKQIERNTY